MPVVGIPILFGFSMCWVFSPKNPPKSLGDAIKDGRSAPSDTAQGKTRNTLAKKLAKVGVGGHIAYRVELGAEKRDVRIGKVLQNRTSELSFDLHRMRSSWHHVRVVWHPLYLLDDCEVTEDDPRMRGRAAEAVPVTDSRSYKYGVAVVELFLDGALTHASASVIEKSHYTLVVDVAGSVSVLKRNPEDCLLYTSDAADE